MANLRLTLACGPYDRTQAIIDGVVRPEGIDLTYLPIQPAEIFWRQLQYKEFDVSEMSMSNYTSTLMQPNPPFIAIPVFPSRVFRHAYFFYNPKSGIKSPKDFEGRRGGVPEYSMTAAVYMRGLLQQLHREHFILDTREPVDATLDLSRFDGRVLDEHAIEVEIEKGESLNDLLAELSKLGVTVTSMRNKANRLEELFVALLARNDAAGTGAAAGN